MPTTNASRVLHRKPGSIPETVVRAEGLRIWTAEGREYLDAVSGGAAVSCLGHGNGEVEDAIRRQMTQVAFYHTSFFTSEPAERLAEALIEGAPQGLSRVLFCSGGSEAVEAALKLARQYWVERGEPSRSKIISRRQSYHGATLGALSVGGNVKRREVYAPMLFDAHFIDPCYEYRLREPDEDLLDYGRRAANELEAAILALGPSNVAAFICEPVVGATLGAVPAVPGYLKTIREICDRHGVLLILDEIMCGIGRTGWHYACAEDGVAPDLLTVAKGLGGGFQPIGAVLVGDRVEAALTEGSGELKHGFTYMAHPAACAAGDAVQRYIRDHSLLVAARIRGEELKAGLDDALREHPNVGDIRGRGLFLGIELVADRSTKAPFDPEHRVFAKFKQAAMERGLLTYPGGGCIDGERGDHILLAPALTISSGECAELIDRLCLALGDIGFTRFAKAP
ncbi:aspartate aminotransferase family protein [Bosea sp. 2KB_26]|uniref:aspartate aminotransferase family protein n=1 Tax=Bosea sp. 2KB_26 TaxID=3237475 RepID=UPI003F90BFDF